MLEGICCDREAAVRKHCHGWHVAVNLPSVTAKIVFVRADCRCCRVQLTFDFFLHPNLLSSGNGDASTALILYRCSGQHVAPIGRTWLLTRLGEISDLACGVRTISFAGLLADPERLQLLHPTYIRLLHTSIRPWLHYDIFSSSRHIFGPWCFLM